MTTYYIYYTENDTSKTIEIDFTDLTDFAAELFKLASNDNISGIEFYTGEDVEL